MAKRYKDYEIVREGKIKIPKVIRADIGYCLMFGHNPDRSHQKYDQTPPKPIAEYDYDTITGSEFCDGWDIPRISPDETPRE